MRAIVAFILIALAGRVLAASDIPLEPPPPGQFVLDKADMLEARDESAVNQIGAALLREHATPLVVVTIASMADSWPHGEIRIETFAHLLFDQWQLGEAELGGETWNTGIMLLVSKNDRQARIQLGGGWGREKDGECQRIMDREIVPEFKKGRFGAGILAGARALDAMARGKTLPSGSAGGGGRTGAPAGSGSGVSPSRSGRAKSPLPSVLGCFGIVLLVVIVGGVLSSLGRASRRGRGLGGGMLGGRRGSGLGWGLGGLLGGYMLGRATSRRRSDSSGGGFFGGLGDLGGGSGGGFSGGGSRGGGFSGGGGATGRW